jgi:GNAT superfamily N-acetyltransferase
VSDEVRVKLHDGSTVLVRPIRPGDKETMRHAWNRLSEKSRYQRFLSPVAELTDGQLAYLTEVDHHDHEALAAFDLKTGDGVGVARFVRLGDADSAEAAVTVIDEWQGRGLGTVLCNLLADRARVEGVRRFTAMLLASNREMLELLASLGPTRELSRDEGTVEIEVELPERGIGEQMARVLKAVAGGTIELATPPWGLRKVDETAGGDQPSEG